MAESDSDQSSNVPEDFNSVDDEHFDSDRSNIEENEVNESIDSDDDINVKEKETDRQDSAASGCDSKHFPTVSHFLTVFP